MKKLLLIIPLALTIFALAACGAPKPVAEEDISYTVNLGMYEGEKMLVSTFTNNTDYTIKNVLVQYELKDDVKDMSAFDKVKELGDFAEEDLKDATMEIGIASALEPGETSKEFPAFFNGTWYYVPNIEIYECMEPSFMQVKYLDGEKIMEVDYDYEGATMSDPMEVCDAIEWPQNEFASIIPKPDGLRFSDVNSDLDDYCSVTIQSVTSDQFKAYVELVKTAGFTKDAEGDEDDYDATNADGLKINVNYSKLFGEITVTLTK